MFILGFVLAGLGIYAAIVGGIWFLAKAFGTSIAWGLLSLFIAPVGLIFAIKYWNISWRPLAMNLGGSVAAVGGAALLGMSVASEAGAGLEQSMQMWDVQAQMDTAGENAAEPQADSTP